MSFRHLGYRSTPLPTANVSFTYWDGESIALVKGNFVAALRELPEGKKFFAPPPKRGPLLAQVQKEFLNREYHENKDDGGYWYSWTKVHS